MSDIPARSAVDTHRLDGAGPPDTPRKPRNQAGSDSASCAPTPSHVGWCCSSARTTWLALVALRRFANRALRGVEAEDSGVQERRHAHGRLLRSAPPRAQTTACVSLRSTAAPGAGITWAPPTRRWIEATFWAERQGWPTAARFPAPELAASNSRGSQLVSATQREGGTRDRIRTDCAGVDGSWTTIIGAPGLISAISFLHDQSHCVTVRRSIDCWSGVASSTFSTQRLAPRCNHLL